MPIPDKPLQIPSDFVFLQYGKDILSYQYQLQNYLTEANGQINQLRQQIMDLQKQVAALQLELEKAKQCGNSTTGTSTV